MTEAVEFEEVSAPTKAHPRSRAVAKAASAAVPARSEAAPTSDLDRILSAAQNLELPMDRVSAMIDLYERLEAKSARKAFDTAFAEMASELPMIERNGTIKTNEKDARGNKTGNHIEQSKYARFEDIIEKITPSLQKFGFALSYRIAQPTADRVVVTGILSHRDGHREETTFGLPIDSSGSKNNVQGWGSSVSYGKRYVTCALLPIVTRGEDDDGKKADMSDEPRTIDAKQSSELKRLCEITGTKFQSFLKIAKAENFDDILAKNFDGFKVVLEGKLPAEGGAR